MTVVNGAPLGSGLAGVMTSSPCERCHLAAAPLIVIERTFSPSRSRLNRDRNWVAVALMVAVPLRMSVEGSYDRARS